MLHACVCVFVSAGVRMYGCGCRCGLGSGGACAFACAFAYALCVSCGLDPIRFAPSPLPASDIFIYAQSLCWEGGRGGAEGQKSDMGRREEGCRKGRDIKKEGGRGEER